MDRADQYFDLITKWEYEKRTEKEIVDKFSKLLSETTDDIDLYYDINDALHWKGYAYQFEVPKGVGYSWDADEYADMVSNVTKSKDKTNELCLYLRNMNNSILTLNSLQFIKFKHLVNLGIFQKHDEYTPIMNMNLYDIYMLCLSEKYSVNLPYKDFIKLVIEKFLMQIGMSYVQLDYYQFRMDMESLLWTITQKDKTKDVYKKVNTIKVAFFIVERELFMWGGKIYFNEDIHKNLVKYLSLIDKDEAKRIVNKYKDSIHLLDDTGYKLLFNML